VKSYLYNFFSIFGFISFLIIIIFFNLISKISNHEEYTLLPKYDAIVILSGNPERAIFASQLYKHGLADKIFLSKEQKVIKNYLISEKNILTYKYYLKILLQNSIPENNIILFGINNKSTIDEAKSLSVFFDSKTLNILVVTNKYHIYRSKLILQKYLPNKNIHFVYPDEFNEKWWKDKYQILNIFNELFKTIFFYLFTDFDNYLSFS